MAYRLYNDYSHLGLSLDDIRAIIAAHPNLTEAQLRKLLDRYAEVISSSPNLVKNYGCLAVFQEFISLSAYDPAHGGNYAIRKPSVERDLDKGMEEYASLCRVHAISAEFMEVNLCDANLEACNFYDVDLQDANLTGANFSYANLRGTYLPRARLAHAILTGAQVEGATFVGATGIETVEVEWLDIGSKDVPQRLEGEQAKKWLLIAAAGRTERKASA